MSLIPLALRIITVRALQNSTLAGACVFDSAIDPIDQRIKQEAQPVIIVYTDEDKQTVAGRDLLNASRELQLTLEFAAATAVSFKVKVEKENGEEGEEELVSYEIPHTDAGLEATLNLIRRQTFRILLSDQGKWPRLWRKFALSVSSVLSRRGASAEKGVRYAAQQSIITTETLSEPAFGQPVEGAWAELLAAFEDDPDPGIQKLAKIIRNEIEVPDLPVWRSAMASLGVNAETADAMGFAPVVNPLSPNDVPTTVAGAEIQTDNGNWNLDANAINEALGPDGT
ncbi:hypothetical protein EGJ58_12970 [Brucella anthropi]|nr:hypothetical protein EGJ58_12970 [Brucella anthropi]